MKTSYPLSLWEHVDFRLDRIYESEPKIASNAPLHSSIPFLSALLIENGSLAIQTKTYSIKASRGQWIFPNTTDARCYIFTKGTKILSINCRLNWADGRFLFEQGLPLVIPSSRFPLMERYARILLKPFRKTSSTKNAFDWKQTHLTFAQYAEFNESLSRWFNATVQAFLKSGLTLSDSTTLDPRLTKVLSQLNEIPLSEHPNILEIASSSGLSRRRLEQIFSKHMHQSPASYFDKRKMMEAQRTLLNPAIPIKNIAQDLGFFHASHFNIWFKNKTGVGPKQFRETSQDRLDF